VCIISIVIIYETIGGPTISRLEFPQTLRLHLLCQET